MSYPLKTNLYTRTCDMKNKFSPYNFVPIIETHSFRRSLLIYKYVAKYPQSTTSKYSVLLIVQKFNLFYYRLIREYRYIK